MTERGILMKVAMVRAMLRPVDPKTQTRRTRGLERLNKEPGTWEWKDGKFVQILGSETSYLWPGECPYGRVGDRLWVKEGYAAPFKRTEHVNGCIYRADADQHMGGYGKGAHRWSADDKHLWRNAMFMPRWAARIVLEITDVRIERLQDISEQDAKAEGADPIAEEVIGHPSLRYRAAFHSLWCSINGIASWQKNPWVWVITFKRVQP